MTKKAHAIGSLNKQLVGKPLKVCGLIANAKKVLTKSGVYMAYLTREDLTGRLEIVAFPKAFQEYGAFINAGQIVLIQGRLDNRRDAMQFIAESVQEVSLDSMMKNAKDENMFDENEKYVRVIAKAEEDVVKPESSDPYTIELSEKMDESSLEYIKRLLTANRGSRKVVINMKTGTNIQTIAVPFGVDVSPELKRQIAEIAK